MMVAVAAEEGSERPGRGEEEEVAVDSRVIDPDGLVWVFSSAAPVMCR